MSELPTVTEFITKEPLREATLVIVLSVLGFVLREVVKPRHSGKINRWRRTVLTTLDPIASVVGFNLIVTKRTEEYVCTVDTDRESLVSALYHEGWVLNPISTVKHREVKNGSGQYAVFSMKHSVPQSSKQWHLFAFPDTDGSGLDLYQHGETDWNPLQGGDPIGHLDTVGRNSMPQTDGDPERVLRDALDNQGIAYTTK